MILALFLSTARYATTTSTAASLMTIVLVNGFHIAALRMAVLATLVMQTAIPHPVYAVKPVEAHLVLMSKIVWRVDAAHLTWDTVAEV